MSSNLIARSNISPDGEGCDKGLPSGSPFVFQTIAPAHSHPALALPSVNRRLMRGHIKRHRHPRLAADPTVPTQEPNQTQMNWTPHQARRRKGETHVHRHRLADDLATGPMASVRIWRRSGSFEKGADDDGGKCAIKTGAALNPSKTVGHSQPSQSYTCGLQNCFTTLQSITLEIRVSIKKLL